MSETDDKPRRDWLAVLVIALLLALIAETGWLIKLHHDGRRESGAPKYAAVRTVRPQAPAPSARPAADPWTVMNASGGEEWDPFQEMQRMRRAMDRMFEESFSNGLRAGAAVPAMTYRPDLDLREGDNEYVVRLDLPGIDKDKIDVRVENGQLILSGERRAESEQTAPNGGFYRSERSFGSFTRSFTLPPDADSENMTAESKNGVLTVHIPKIAGTKKPAASIPVH